MHVCTRSEGGTDIETWLYLLNHHWLVSILATLCASALWQRMASNLTWQIHTSMTVILMLAYMMHGLACKLTWVQGFTALHLAAIGGHLKVVQLLVAYGADATAQTQEVFHMACLASRYSVL